MGYRGLAAFLAARCIWYLALSKPLVSFGTKYHFIKKHSPKWHSFPVEKRTTPAFPILTHHRLTAGKQDPFFGGTPISAFEAQIRYLARYYQIMPLPDLVSHLYDRKAIPARAIALTFDDGYADNYSLGYPVLRKYGASATIFLTTDFIDQSDLPWNDKVAYAIKHTNQTGLYVNVSECNLSLNLETSKSRLASLDRLLLILRRIPHAEKLAVMEYIFSELKVKDLSPLNGTMLTWDQVREMRQNGITFGAHTASHPILSRIPIAEAKLEMKNSRDKIQHALDEAIDLFAYPNGTQLDFEQIHKALSKSLGFRASFTTIHGTNNSETDPFELRRGGPYERTLPEFAFKLAYYGMQP